MQTYSQMNSGLKRAIQKEVTSYKADLKRLCKDLFDNPEVAWQEHRSSRLVADFLRRNGFLIDIGICGLSTAFRASYGVGTPVIAFLAEYDALPEVGHACGHNIIASAAAGAAVAARLAIDTYGGCVVVLGCPAEEQLGGKVIMANQEAFEKVDAAMIVHPCSGGGNWAGILSTSSLSLDIEYWGKKSHAASDPWSGINALEALIQAFNNINSLRAHIIDKARINGIIHKGGTVPNIIPDYASGGFILRAPTDEYLGILQGRTIKCFEGAALSTGARLEWRAGLKCASMRNNSSLVGLWKTNMNMLGISVGGIVEKSISTDVGNVSHVVPCMQTFLSISDKNLAFHTPEFTDAAGSDTGCEAVFSGAKGLAMTATDLLASSELMDQIKAEFLLPDREKSSS